MRPTPVEHSNLVYELNFLPGGDPEAMFAEHQAWAQRHAEPWHRRKAARQRSIPTGGCGWAMSRRISSAHAVNFFIEPILASHDHAQFEVFCYANVACGRRHRRRAAGYADHWRDICLMPATRKRAEMVRATRSTSWST